MIPKRHRRHTGRIEISGSAPVVKIPEAHLETRVLEVVLKCDVIGSIEAVTSVLERMEIPGVRIMVIHSGVGPVNKNDLLMALTGSRLIVGFQVGTAPRIDQLVKEHGVEVRLYSVVYALAEDLRRIAGSLAMEEPEERVTGRARVIALFKSGRKGVIMGCEVYEGVLALGSSYRIIGAMGPVYSSRIESLQVDKVPVKEARKGRQAGIKVKGFDRVKVGDLVECFERKTPVGKAAWQPRGAVLQQGS
ncbi:MAG: hypothetical protein HPY84_09455 [Syntrophobacteraceae bacterium]|nr:hypothetical protein [Syntrophobacteraceae bacterium]